MSPDFIYTMKDLRKVVPPKREILKGIWLSFYYGAKIGVLGLNGAGKSSLLRIMAGVRIHDFLGEARALGTNITDRVPASRSPSSIPRRTVVGNVEEGVAETREACVQRFERAVSAKLLRSARATTR